ncbi:hypothetical protein D9758_018177 [Tetrapyrgos nigripes]|uniref:Uncharacterized protein n=1 Tax=Tetrapyrgos nigripes TaxID=182062 RepID=A0A8H5EVU0_9AGAR|nr:hypothetical protein D9758_018177 [Tetrapyrgos nigripes]
MEQAEIRQTSSGGGQDSTYSTVTVKYVETSHAPYALIASSMPKPPPLTMQQRRVRTIMATLPIIVATGYVLYKRLVLGEPQRTLPRLENATEKENVRLDPKQ